jgi:hypothetical protein
MSNRRKRQARRHHRTPHEQWMAERYRPPRQYTPTQLRQLVLEDGVNRRATPMTWYIGALKYIAAKERKHIDDVHIEIEQACVAACGLPLPTSGDMSTL